MPELPEVETIVRGLRAALIGRGIEEAGFGHRDFLRTPAARIARALQGAVIQDIRRAGKHIVFAIEKRGEKFWWIVHLGMTGQFVIEPTGSEPRPHTHAWIELKGGRDSLRYTDIRRFGRMELVVCEDPSALPARLARLGPEPLEIAEADFVERLLARKARVKALLLDQRFLRGLGNIYADEILFRAGLHPAALGSRVSRPRASALWRAIREVLEEAIAHGGSSISDYVDASGQAGSFQDLHRVYGRAGEPCLSCGAVLRRGIVAGRGTTFCPRCQHK